MGPAPLTEPTAGIVLLESAGRDPSRRLRCERLDGLRFLGLEELRIEPLYHDLKPGDARWKAPDPK